MKIAKTRFHNVNKFDVDYSFTNYYIKNILNDFVVIVLIKSS